MKIEFRLLGDILAKTIYVKVGSFDAITHERFLLMTAITYGVKINWSSLVFDILKDMVTPCSRQAKGYAIQICVLLKNVSGLELGESRAFPSSRILTGKTVHRYVVINEKVGGEEVADKPRVKKKPVKKAASKKRPATDAATEPVVKKKRTTKSKSVCAKGTLEIMPVAQEAVPLQIAPIPVAPAEQPPVPKRKTQKRKRKLILSPDDEIVDSETATAEPAVGGSVEEESILGGIVVEQGPAAEIVEEQQAETAVDSVNVETVVESVDEPVSLPAVADVLNECISTADDVDVIIEQSLQRPLSWRLMRENKLRNQMSIEQLLRIKQLKRQMKWNVGFLPYEVLGIGVEEMETEDVEQSTDEAMSLEYILMTIPAECPLPSAYVEITKIILGETISIHGVNEGDWYKASLPKIPAADKRKAPHLERDPVKGNPINLKRLATLKIDKSYFDKEALIFSWAETDSTRVALNRRTYILTKYRELLIRKFLEARKINFTPGEGSSATDLKVMEMLSDLHLFVVEDLKEQTMAHSLKWEKTFCSKFLKVAHVIQTPTSGFLKFLKSFIVEPVSVFVPRQSPVISWRLSQLCTAFVQYSLFSGLSTADISSFVSTIAFERTVLRDVQTAHSSISVAPSVQMMIDQSPFSSSTSDDSSMHFDDNDTADTSISLPPAAIDVMESLAKLRASIDQIRSEQFRRKEDANNLKDLLLVHLRDLEKRISARFDEQDRVHRALRKDTHDQKNLLSLDLKSTHQKLSAQIAAAAFDTLDVRKVVKEINAKVNYLDEHVAEIRSDQLELAY
ncbi:hypothetical protein F511_29336 [Dorcoceras hygrometricum]|uniref:Splicing factor 3B subunit 1-like n=1 Tax=Dorcoceras hygrometricum TaxID=472368 RepID=A0A2Z7DD00_9LAMI|nr:hypothetical protein F511_29336 [Dorcoceras hygrometricum]